MAYKEEVKQAALEWLDTPKELRQPSTKAAFMRKWGIKSSLTPERWQRERDEKRRDNGGEPEEYNPDNYLAESAKKVDAALIRACEKGNASALKSYYQITNRLVERQENINIDLTADDIAERVNRVRRELENRRMVTMPAKPPALPPDIRESKG